MELQHGFIHEQFEVKLLILYILRQLPAAINGEELAELVLIDGGINYFDYKICLSELEQTTQVEHTAEGYRVTAKGNRNCQVLEDSLPYSVRAKAGRAAAPVINEMRRQQMILANHESSSTGGVIVYLSMGDGMGDLIDLKLLATDERQADMIERNFKKNAEKYYQHFLQVLTEEKGSFDE